MPEIAEKEELLSAKEAAAYLKLAPKYGFMTVQKWVRKGLLRAGRAGDHYLFRKQDLDDFAFSKK